VVVLQVFNQHAQDQTQRQVQRERVEESGRCDPMQAGCTEHHWAAQQGETSAREHGPEAALLVRHPRSQNAAECSILDEVTGKREFVQTVVVVHPNVFLEVVVEYGVHDLLEHLEEYEDSRDDGVLGVEQAVFDLAEFFWVLHDAHEGVLVGGLEGDFVGVVFVVVLGSNVVEFRVLEATLVIDMNF